MGWSVFLIPYLPALPVLAAGTVVLVVRRRRSPRAFGLAVPGVVLLWWVYGHFAVAALMANRTPGWINFAFGDAYNATAGFARDMGLALLAVAALADRGSRRG